MGEERRAAAAAWLEWQLLAGVDCCLDPEVRRRDDRPLPAHPGDAAEPRSVPKGREAALDARRLAASCRSLAELEETLREYEGCALKRTATRLCFADGSADAALMLVGEAPGAEEDRLGRPFVGPSGQLLDRTLAWIGLDRSRVYITNLIFWRPPGNRPPTAAEIAVCLPFLERQIALVRPRLLLFLGGLAARTLLGVQEGVSRLRGREFLYHGEGLSEPITARITFHPAYLLRQPAQKRYFWRDLLSVAERLEQLGARAHIA